MLRLSALSCTELLEADELHDIQFIEHTLRENSRMSHEQTKEIERTPDSAGSVESWNRPSPKGRKAAWATQVGRQTRAGNEAPS
jgi:hypothetical protein